MATVSSVSHTFDSMADFVDYCEGRSDIDNYARSSRNGTESFTKTESWEDAVSLAHGWDEGARRIEAQRLILSPKGQKNRRVAAMSEVGPGVINMGALNAGHPQPYVVLRETNVARNGKGKVVRILVNIGASGMVSTDVIERRGAAICALIDALERAGRRVEVVAVSCASNSSIVKVNDKTPRLTFRITLKAAHQRLNMPSLAFAIAHPSMLRRFIFSARERQTYGVRSGYGYGMHAGSVQSVEVPEADRDCTIYLGRMWGLDKQWESESGATAWVRREMENQGVTLV